VSSIPTLDARSLPGSGAEPSGTTSALPSCVGGPADATPLTPGAHALGLALREYGFCTLVGHDIDDRLVAPAYAAVRRFFALPDAVKRRYQLAGRGGARGYTPFRTEKAKDQEQPDLKEFWHVGRELAPDDPLREHMLPNVWPDEVPELRPTLLALYRALDHLGARVLSALAIELGLPARWFEDKIDHGNSILRPLHYPPLGPGQTAGVRSAAHEDINLITLMIVAGEPGLEILRRDGTWLPVEAGPGEVIVNIGDMLQRLTNHVLPSTTHRVVNPDGPWATRSRYSMPFFLHPNPEFSIATLGGCCSDERPNRYPTPITADDYLQQRLREIGLL
jgi:isopenicillin N synthase-like dioxygenase